MTGLDEGEAMKAENIEDLRAIAEHADAVKAGEARLREAVQSARARGRSWNRIAVSLDISGSEAQRRFADGVSKPEKDHGDVFWSTRARETDHD